MAVTVEITDASIILAMDTPGGVAYEWLEKVIGEIKNLAFANSPVNNPLNAMHRGGKVGTYKAGWRVDGPVTSGHEVSGGVRNVADHAYYVEWGRGEAMGKDQVFSWTGFKPPGSIHKVQNTGGYPRQRVLYYATNDVLEAQTDFYVPLL